MSPALSDSAARIAQDVAAGRRRAIDVCESALAHLRERNPSLNAFVETCEAQAVRRATEIDAQVRAGRDPGPLAGVPIAVKDNICTRFASTTCGSNGLRGFRPPYNATVVDRIEAAGGVVIGKTNLDEFGMGSSTEHSTFGPTHNPWNHDLVCGGSSGGSAAAVAAGIVPVALGSDTGGSVRQPAAFCGIVGLKPTYSRVSRYGLVSYGSSLEQVGVLARSVGDAARLLAVIAGADGRDATCTTQPPIDDIEMDTAPNQGQNPQQLRIGVLRNDFAESLDPEIAKAIKDAISVFASLGAEIIELEIAHAQYAVAAYYILATAEASSNLARYDGVHFGHRLSAPRKNSVSAMEQLYYDSRGAGFGPEVKRRIMLGTFALSAGYADKFYGKALQVRRLLQEEMAQVFAGVDVFLGPATPTLPFRIGQRLENPLQMYLADVYTVTANLTGMPALVLPCGVSQGGLPIGMQLTGPHFSESALLRIARRFERETGAAFVRSPL